MEDIELVIKISKDVYKDIMAHNREMREGGKSAYYFERLIQNGTALSKSEIVKLINQLSIEACTHGADAGGPYNQNKEGLINALEVIKTYYGLVEYDIGKVCNDEGWSSYGFIERKS